MTILHRITIDNYLQNDGKTIYISHRNEIKLFIEPIEFTQRELYRI